MATPGLSLVGFMDDPQLVLQHLKEHCEPDPLTKTDVQLLADWTSAKAKLGAPIPGAGSPEIRDLPPEAEQHIATLCQQHWYTEGSRAWSTGADFKLVEIDKLLAYQLVIDTDRSDHHCDGLNKPPTLAEMLNVCLPIQPHPENLKVSLVPPPTAEYHHFPRAAVMTSKGRNLRMGLQGVFNDPNNLPNSVGFFFGFGSPGAHVVRLNGRAYLHNGFHRALGLRAAGATHMPCIVRDVGSPAELGLSPPATFDIPLLESASPPALGHYTEGRAWDVKLRSLRTILHVSWAMHVVLDE